MNELINSLQPLLASGEFWVLVSFIGLVALAIYYRAPRQITKALDQRAEIIARDLEEAKRLYDEAQALLQKHEARIANAQAEADELMAAARRQAEDYAHERSTSLSEQIKRQEKQAEARIEAARRAAIAALHEEAADLALAAAKNLISEKADPAALIDRGLDEIESALNADKLHKTN